MDQGATLSASNLRCGALALLALLPLAAGPGRKPRPAPARIVNLPALAPFLEALRRLESGEPKGVVRILHFGDSHTSADMWTGQLRRRLQARFGDAGPGCLLPGRPWRGYPHEGVRFLAGQAWPAQSLRSGQGDVWVGLTGASLAPVPGEAFTVRASFAEARVQLLGSGELLAGVRAEDAIAALAPIQSPVPQVAAEPLPNLPVPPPKSKHIVPRPHGSGQNQRIRGIGAQHVCLDINRAVLPMQGTHPALNIGKPVLAI